MANVIVLKGVSKQFAQQWVLEDVSFALEEGEVAVVIGPSGCGKTTLLRCITGLETVDAGEVLVFGKNVGDLRNAAEGGLGLRRSSLDDLRRDIGMVFQHLFLWPNKTVWENITLAPNLLGTSREEIAEHCMALLEMAGLSSRINAYPRNLSGGEQQRVALVRALAVNPRVLLLDEITAALDPERVWQVCELVRRLAIERRTMMIVTHEMGFARDVAHRVLFLDKGKLIEDARAGDFFNRPNSSRAQSFLAMSSAVRNLKRDVHIKLEG